MSKIVNTGDALQQSEIDELFGIPGSALGVAMTPKVYGYRTVLERVCYDHMDRQYGVWQRLKVLATRAALTILLEGVHPKNRVYLQRLEYLPPCEGRSNAEWFIKKVRLFK